VSVCKYAVVAFTTYTQERLLGGGGGAEMNGLLNEINDKRKDAAY
jgi:hypothetical protein